MRITRGLRREGRRRGRSGGVGLLIIANVVIWGLLALAIAVHELHLWDAP